MKRLPIKSAKDLAKKYNLKQVTVVAWDGERSHVVTYGNTIFDCSIAAQCGNIVKKALGYPDILCKTDPSRVSKLKKRIKELEAAKDDKDDN